MRDFAAGFAFIWLLYMGVVVSVGLPVHYKLTPPPITVEKVLGMASGALTLIIAAWLLMNRFVK